MKKLLNLLSLLTISGTAVTTTIAASPYQKEEKINSDINFLQAKNLIRSKREKTCPVNDKYDPFGLNNSYYITLRPELIEKILGNLNVDKIKTILLSKDSDFREFRELKNSKEQYIIAEAINNDLSRVTSNEKWKTWGNRSYAIELAYDKHASNPSGFSLKYREYSESDSVATKILFNKGSCSNKYFDKLKIDFPDWNKEEIYLKMTEHDDTDDNIKKVLKEKYPNLIVENIKIIEKKDYEYSNQSFELETTSTPSLYPARGDVQEINYSIEKLKPKFIYMSKTKINELSNKIKNHHLVKQWLRHINDYNSNLPTTIQNLENLVGDEKKAKKIIEKEIIKGYVRDLSTIIELIETQWKIEALKNTINGIKEDIARFKEVLENINQKILDKFNTQGLALSCANIATVIAGAGGLSTAFITSTIVPIVGTIVGGVSTIIAGSCAIANT